MKPIVLSRRNWRSAAALLSLLALLGGALAGQGFATNSGRCCSDGQCEKACCLLARHNGGEGCARSSVGHGGHLGHSAGRTAQGHHSGSASEPAASEPAASEPAASTAARPYAILEPAVLRGQCSEICGVLIDGSQSLAVDLLRVASRLQEAPTAELPGRLRVIQIRPPPRSISPRGPPA